MITAIFTTITEVVTGFAGALATAFESIMSIVWSGTGLTTFGILLLIGFGVSLVYYAVRKVFDLVSIGGGKSRK